MLFCNYTLLHICPQEDGNKPTVVLSSTELTESGSFENPSSDYASPQSTPSHKKVIKDSIKDDLAYPIYTAKFDYEATSPSELSFKKGDQLHIKSKGDGKTWHARVTVGAGKEGNIPKSYITALDDEE